MDPALDALVRSAARKEGLIAFAGGLPSDTQFPKRALAASFARALGLPRSMGDALQYGWPEGHDPLRAQIAARLVRRGADVSAADVIVTNGAQQALALAVQAVCRRGDAIAVDDVSYPSALNLFRGRGLQLTRLAGARERRSTRRAPAQAPRMAYVMPAVANPTGRACSKDELRALLAPSEAFLLEDDAYAELSFGEGPERPLLADAPARTFHVGTFSKVLCPGLRVGWLVVPRALRARVRELKEAADLQAGTLTQLVVSDYLAHHDFEARLHRLRRFYERRRDQMAKALSRHLPAWQWTLPAGGFSFWVQTESDLGEMSFLRAALQEGVSFDPGSLFRRDQETAPLALRLCFSATPADRIEEGCRRLARAWSRATRQGGKVTASASPRRRPPLQSGNVANPWGAST